VLTNNPVDCMNIVNGEVRAYFDNRIQRLDNAIDLTSIESMKEKLSIERERIVAARDDVLSTLKQHMK
tara:strand:+ start:7829 stop:8032 length:204 start_codon:yes stop_codon:yes gene_type:complete